MSTTMPDILAILPTMNALQANIHKGDAYSTSFDGTISGSSTMLVLSESNGKEIHFHTIGGMFSKGDIRISLYASPTASNIGTAIDSIRNLNRKYTDDNTMPIYTSPTITDEGTLVSSSYIPITGNGANVESASLYIAGGRVLNSDTKYLFKIENLDSSEVDFGVNFIWTEHT